MTSLISIDNLILENKAHLTWHRIKYLVSATLPNHSQPVAFKYPSLDTYNGPLAVYSSTIETAILRTTCSIYFTKKEKERRKELLSLVHHHVKVALAWSQVLDLVAIVNLESSEFYTCLIHSVYGDYKLWHALFTGNLF